MEVCRYKMMKSTLSNETQLILVTKFKKTILMYKIIVKEPEKTYLFVVHALSFLKSLIYVADNFKILTLKIYIHISKGNAREYLSSIFFIWHPSVLNTVY